MGRLERSLYLGLCQVRGHANACAAARRKMGGPMVSSIFLISLTVLPMSACSLFGCSETSTCKTDLGGKKNKPKTLILLFLDPSVSVIQSGVFQTVVSTLSDFDVVSLENRPGAAGGQE